MAASAPLHLTLHQGDTWAIKITYRQPSGAAVDLSGCTARMQLRPAYASSTVVLEASTSNGRIALNGPAGEIVITVAAADTAAIAAAVYVYDLELTFAGGIVEKAAHGTITVVPEVTRD